MFYRLVSLGQIPNTKNSYKYLSHYTARAREASVIETEKYRRIAERLGTLPIDAFADEGRTVKGDIPKFQSIDDLLNRYMDIMKALPKDYFENYVPKWVLSSLRLIMFKDDAPATDNLTVPVALSSMHFNS